MNSRLVLSLMLLSGAAFAASSCIEDVEFTGEQTAGVPVIYSDLMAGDSLRLDLSMSVFFLHDTYNFHSGGYSDEFCAPLRGRKIEVLASVNDGSPFPMDLFSSPEGPEAVKTAEQSLYRFKSPYIVQPGDEIQFNVSIEGMDPLSSRAKVPELPSVSLVKMDSISVDNALHATIRIDDPAGERNFYRFFANGMMEVSYQNWDYVTESYTEAKDTVEINFNVTFPSLGTDIIGELLSSEQNGYLSDDLFNGKQYTTTLDLNYYYWYESARPLTLNLSVGSLSDDCYYFNQTINMAGDELTLYIGEAVQMYSNVQGGYGCCMGSTFTSFLFDFTKN